MLLSDPKDIKSAGDNMPVDATWEKEKVSVMEEKVTQKFFQNKILAKKLCETGDLPLYEATRNIFWGCGLRINSKLWLTGNPPGQNKIGKILVEVRSKLLDGRENRPTATVTAPVPAHDSTDETSHEQLMLDSRATHPENSDAVQAPQEPTSITNDNKNEEDGVPPPTVVTSTPSADAHASGDAPTIPHEEMELSNQSTVIDEANLSINNVSSSSSETTNYRDITTDGVFDLKKIESWTLPSIQRRTAELHQKVAAARRRSSQFATSRLDRPGNTSTHSLQGTRREDTTNKSRATYHNRSFTNSNFKKGVLENMGFSSDSAYVQSIENLENSNVSDRRRSKQKK